MGTAELIQFLKLIDILATSVGVATFLGRVGSMYPEPKMVPSQYRRNLPVRLQ